MDIFYFLKGIIVGIVIAVPVGPIGVLCIHRSLTKGRAHGLVSGLGAATADVLYGSMAAFGLTFLSDLLLGHQITLRFGGGAFLLILGIRTYLTKFSDKPANGRNNGLLTSYVSTFLLTMASPTTMLLFLAVSAGLGIVDGKGGFINAGFLVVGVFLGSAIWWTVLAGTSGVLRDRVGDRWLLWVSRISGVALGAFGISALVSIFFMK
jgi:threonine/homoserine/homoserine lactone efflux protein